jgi:hypothetical protein
MGTVKSFMYQLLRVRPPPVSPSTPSFRFCFRKAVT